MRLYTDLMKGVILAGGEGTRLFPLTKYQTKHLLPVYDKPLINYPLATLMAAQIREILLITKLRDMENLKSLLGNGEDFGISISYKVQESANGIAEALLIAEDFLAGEKVALILGDNIFYGIGLGGQLSKFHNVSGAQIFGYPVSNPEEYGVAILGNDGRILHVEEKPKTKRSNLAIPGLYFYDENASTYCRKLKPSLRGELEITDLNSLYLEMNQLNFEVLPRGTAWLDTGSFNSLHDATTFVRVLEERQGTKIACLEEVAWRNGWISRTQLMSLANSNPNIIWREYLMQLQ